ncbi:hypothetical protein Agub_g9315 [Astrephomene gubernaculifera]|uniref:Uncharacterized protein n=1 Tax=Astrephomene gubernaculifera TaxID=47775 RepID=A0AAD3HNV5_9CHLO|nr:hypothetical protein Agub_g9315 [Astrephomene gubernaculifera]
MALALLSRRQGRLLSRALSMAETCIGGHQPARTGAVEDAEIGPDMCSTSQQQPSQVGGSWPRGLQARFFAVNNEPTIRYVPVPEPEHDDFSTEPTAYTQLLSAIRAAKTLKRLQHLVSTYSDRFDAVHIAAAVARLPRLIKYRPDDLVDRSDVVVTPVGGLPRVRRKHGAQPKASHLEDGARLAAQLDNMLPAHVKHFFPRQAACTIWSFGELRRRGIVDAMSSLPDVMLAVSKGDMEPLRVHGHGVDFAQLLQGLAKLGHNDPDFMARLLPLLKERLGSLQQRELQMAAWALASLGYGSQKIMLSIAEQLLQTSTAFLLPSGCSSVFWAYAKADVEAPQLFDSLAASIIGQALLIAPQDVATTLWACGRLGYRNHELVAVLGDAMLRSLASASDLEVSSAVEALAVLGYEHKPLLDAVTEGILAEPLIGAEPVCIARVLFAYGKLGRRGERDVELASALAAALVRRLPIVREDTLSLACRGLIMFGYKDQEVLAAYTARAEQLLPRCNDLQLLAVLRLLGGAGHAHYQLAVASARHLQTIIIPGGRFRSASTAVEVLYHCARQGVEDPAAAEELLKFAGSHVEELRPVDAARLLVIGQVMNKQDALLTSMEEVVLRNTEELNKSSAEAALRSAQALGRSELVAALSSRLAAIETEAGAA